MWLVMLLLLGAGLGIGGLLLFSRRPEDSSESSSRFWSDADQLEDNDEAEAADSCDTPESAGGAGSDSGD